MVRKKLFMKTMSSILAAAVAITSSGWMPVTAFAAEEMPASAIKTVSGENSPREAASGLTDFTSKAGDDKINKDETQKTVTLDNTSEDHFAVYNGLQNKTKAFTLEADINLIEGETSAALIFGIDDKENPSSKWYGANINTATGEGDDKERFNIFQAGNASGLEAKRMTLTDAGYTSGPVHLKVTVTENGNYTYTFGAKDGQENTLTGTIEGWQGGYVGILTFKTKATFSNISFNELYNTNLTGLTNNNNGSWEVTEEGLYSNATDKGDSFLYSQTQGTDFVYSTDVIFKKDAGAAALTFRSNNNSDSKESYAVNIAGDTKKCKFWRWQKNKDYQLIDEKAVEATADNKYTLKVVAIGPWISYYVNDELIASTGDYTLQKEDKGQGTCIKDGYFGLLNFNGEMVFQNTLYHEINDEFTPLLTDIDITSSAGTVETKSQFFQTEPINIQYVKNNAETVNVEVAKKSENATITITGPDGMEYAGGKNIPVAEGVNYINVKSSITGTDGLTAEVTYRVNVHRRQPDAIYYNEPHRGQYHYSVKDGWGNDPNGLVYYNGIYHFFYQFYDDTKWGPMHWAHATSEDLIHWEEKPMAFYPDANGAMFSGCMVIDEKNQSGLFGEGTEGGLVALITEDGNGQRIKLAYSKDGNTWTKSDTIAADWTDDPLGSDAFRDPKVFRWENKWFMVIAGGPLRIYSSDNLVNWKCESTYPDLHTECPDLYPIKADDGNIKWVLSRGGRYYKIGDFKEADGKWSFVPDNTYAGLAGAENDGIMNFGKDSYAAMTWYIQDFGTSQDPTLPDILEINWANTWDDYCNLVADKAGQKFNGIYNLVLKAGIKKDETGKYVLTQTPIEKYQELRNTENKTELKDVTVSENNTLLKDFKGDCYEIVSHFTPETGTKKIGFKVRTGASEETAIIYDLEAETLSIDRSKSGIKISNKFAETDIQKNVTKNADGTVDLHIYVDRGIVEVFTKDYTVAGANQIFPSISSLGASVFAEGSDTKADITIYPMNSIWTDKIEITEDTKPSGIESSSLAENTINVGDSINLDALLLPLGVKQDITWSADDDSMVSLTTNPDDATSVELKALKAGTAKVFATSTADPSLKKEFTITIFENNFDTNLAPFVKNGNWMINGDTLSVSNTGANDYYMTEEKNCTGEYTLETNIKYTKGLINIFFAANTTNPFTDNAYAIQFSDNSTIKLFRFAGEDITTADMGSSINDGSYHNIKITKTSDSVIVYVDGKGRLLYTFDKNELEDFYNNAHVGIGLWDGALEVQCFKNLSANEKETEYNVTFSNKFNAESHATAAASLNGSIFNEGKIKASDKIAITLTADIGYLFSKDNMPVITAAGADTIVPVLSEDKRTVTATVTNFTTDTDISVSGTAVKDSTENTGNIEIDTSNTDTNAGKTELSPDPSILEENKNELVEAFGDNKQVVEQSLEAGGKISISLKVDKSNIQQHEEEAIKELKLDTSITMGAVLDIKLIAKCYNAQNSEQATTNVTKITKPVEISIPVTEAEKLIAKPVESGYKRNYYIIRIHEGKAEKLGCSIKDNKLLFSSGLFSTYVLMYEDTKEMVPPEITPPETTIPTTRPTTNPGHNNGGYIPGPQATTSVPTATNTPAPSKTPVPSPNATNAPVQTSSPVPTAVPSAVPVQTPSPVPSGTQAPDKTDNNNNTSSTSVKKGSKVTVNNANYTVTSVKTAKTVQFTGLKKNIQSIIIPTAIKIPASVKIKGKNYKVTSIAQNAFKNNKKLKEITIGKNIISIGKNAFKGCKNLKNIKINTQKLKLKNVGSKAFKGINSKAVIKAPESKVKAYKKIAKAKGAGKNVKVVKLK